MRSRVLTATTLATATLLTLSGCAGQEPSNDRIVEEVSVVEILVEPNNTEHLVISELYAQTLTRLGKEATLKLLQTQEHPLGLLARSYGDVYIVCAGKLVENVNPQRAGELREEYSIMDHDGTPASQDQKREDIYSALMATMMANLDATDPSNAQGCADSAADPKTSLANNLVPIYRKPVLDREERQMLNYMSGLINTQELEELVAKVKAGESLNDVVAAYLDSSGLEEPKETARNNP